MSHFDAAAATAAYLATLPPAAHAKATAYTQGGHWLLLWGWLVGMLVALIILKSGVLRRLRDRIDARGPRPKSVAFAVAAVFSLLSFVLTLPWSSYADWGRETGYGLTRQVWIGWLADQLKAEAISIIVYGLLALCIYILIRRAPRSWWAWSGAVVGAFFLIGMVLAPVLIEPLFNSYKPAPPGPVRDQVVALARATGVPSDKILIYDGSKQSERYTANVSGIGSSARVAMSDTMFKQGADLAEVRGVVGHEMGHYALHHSLKLAATFSLLALAVLGLTHLLYPMVESWLGERGSVRGIADPAAMPILTMIVGTILLIATPISNSAVRIAESQADDFSLTHAHEPDGLAKALVKTIEYRAATPGRIEEILFYDHPAVGRRVRHAMDWKAANPALVGAPAN